MTSKPCWSYWQRRLLFHRFMWHRFTFFCWKSFFYFAFATKRTKQQCSECKWSRKAVLEDDVHAEILGILGRILRKLMLLRSFNFCMAKLFILEKRRLSGHLIEVFHYLKGPVSQTSTDFWVGPVCDRTRDNGLNVRQEIQTKSKKAIFYYEDGETLPQAVQRVSKCLIPGIILGHTERGSEQPDLIEDVCAVTAEGLDWKTFKGLFQPRPFCNSMLLSSQSGHINLV